MGNKSPLTILVMAWASVMPGRIFAAYRANCDGIYFPARNITSVMGEARPSSVAGEPVRFHAGVDIADAECAAGNPVGAIYGGTVTAVGTDVPGCIGTDCIRIRDSAGHAFDYIHVSPRVSEKQGVGSGQQIGFIDFSAHLHLNDVDLTDGIKLNPQRANALDYVGRPEKVLWRYEGRKAALGAPAPKM